MQIHISRDGKPYGPYPLEVVKTYLKEGRLSLEDLAWYEGVQEWVRLGDMREVDPVPPPPPPPPPSTRQSPKGPAALPDSPASSTTALVDRASSAPAPAGPAFNPLEVPLGRVDIVESIRWPLRQPDVVKRGWWVPFLGFVPVLGFIALRGWRLDLVRRLGKGEAQRMPESADLGRFLADGLKLWLMTLLYWIPLVVIGAVFGADWLIRTLTILWWALQALFTDTGISFGALVMQVVVQLFVELALPLLYWVLIYPLYRIGAMRYALTNDMGCFFQVLQNLRHMLALLPELLLIFFFDLLILRFVGWIVDAVLLSIGIGFLFIPMVYWPFYYWTTGHLLGQTAAKLQRRIDAGSASPGPSSGEVAKTSSA